jgi:hypothetical protein
MIKLADIQGFAEKIERDDDTRFSLTSLRPMYEMCIAVVSLAN